MHASAPNPCLTPCISQPPDSDTEEMDLYAAMKRITELEKARKRDMELQLEGAKALDRAIARIKKLEHALASGTMALDSVNHRRIRARLEMLEAMVL